MHMLKRRFWFPVLALPLAAGAFALALVASGCGGGAVPDEPEQDPATQPLRLGDQIDISLADLLRKPRAELAEMADDVLTKAQVREKA
jgi:hypothetical protein